MVRNNGGYAFRAAGGILVIVGHSTLNFAREGRK
jgi:hypothetical protein